MLYKTINIKYFSNHLYNNFLNRNNYYNRNHSQFIVILGRHPAHLRKLRFLCLKLRTFKNKTNIIYIYKIKRCLVVRYVIIYLNVNLI